MKNLRFIQGKNPSVPTTLSRYLPIVPGGIISTWLNEHAHPEDAHPWALDPFGASPQLIIEAAQAGWNVLVAANNPIIRFLVALNANPPTKDELQSVMASLASSMKGSERVELHIRAIYTIHCHQCGLPVEVEAYIWEKDASEPQAALYECASCGASGEFPLRAEDAARARIFSSNGLHRARALERVAPGNDPDREYAETALQAYSPRAIYSLFTLINKLDVIPLQDRQRQLLQAMLLNACDAGNVLWRHPTELERPRQISTPTRFRENNLWLSLEKFIENWGENKPHFQITKWPKLPTEGNGICVFEGPLRKLIQVHEENPEVLAKIKAVIFAVPRPNQAFWMLSALWAGWIWGKEAAAPFKSVLRRKRYDWSWHTTALHSAFQNLSEIITPDIPLFGVTGELEAGLLTSLIVAANLAGFELNGLALHDEQAQFEWLTFPLEKKDPIGETYQAAQQEISRSIKEHLMAYGQPVKYMNVLAQGLARVAASPSFLYEIQAGKFEPNPTTEGDEISLGQTYSTVQTLLREMMTYRGGFLRYGSGEVLETSFWWIKEDFNPLPFADRLEISVVDFLVKNSPCSLFQIYDHLLDEFRGLMTPDQEWLHIIVESYATPNETNQSLWRLRLEDQPSHRRKDLIDMHAQLVALGNKLKLLVEVQENFVTFRGKEKQYIFYPTVSAILGKILTKPVPSPEQNAVQPVIVLPGGRANLVAYKLRQDPRLRALCKINPSETRDDEMRSVNKWVFLKSRHLRWLTEHAMLTQENFDELMNEDPLRFSISQMRLI